MACRGPPGATGQRVSTGQTVRVVINAATYPKEVRTQMQKIESGAYSPADIDLFQDLQRAYAKRLVSRVRPVRPWT